MQKKLTRDIEHKLLGGVLAGFANYFGHDRTLWRIGFVIGLIFTGFAPLGIIYIIAWVIMSSSITSEPEYHYTVEQ